MKPKAPDLHHYYDLREGLFHPTALTSSPWDSRNQGGVPLSGLVAHLAEQTSSPVPMVTSRLTIDILRPTPVVPLEGRVRIVREGRRLQMIDVELVADGQLTVRASALRMRLAESPATVALDAALEPPPPGRTMSPPGSKIGALVETRLERGGMGELGPGTVWIRIIGQVVAGTPVSPFVQAALAADFGSGLSAYVDYRAWTFANVDIGLHLFRVPEGPWLKLDAETHSAGQGTALVDGVISDRNGPIGQTHQTLFVDRKSG